MKLKICHLYPDVLNLYGDRGNILCLRKRLEWRGIGCIIDEKKIGDPVDFSAYDFFFVGGGQDFEQALLLEDCRKKKEDWKAAIEDGIPFLCVCGGYQLLGHSYETADGRHCEYLGAVDFYTVGSHDRMIGNLAFRLLPASGGSVVIGFENHGGRTFLGPGVEPLGIVLAGHGNGDRTSDSNGRKHGRRTFAEAARRSAGKSSLASRHGNTGKASAAAGTEGMRYKNVFGTYCHGPVLPKNPAFCDFLLETALTRKYGSAVLAPLPDTLEQKARQVMLHRMRLDRYC